MAGSLERDDPKGPFQTKFFYGSNKSYASKGEIYQKSLLIRFMLGTWNSYNHGAMDTNRWEQLKISEDSVRIHMPVRTAVYFGIVGKIKLSGYTYIS